MQRRVQTADMRGKVSATTAKHVRRTHRGAVTCGVIEVSERCASPLGVMGRHPCDVYIGERATGANVAEPAR